MTFQTFLEILSTPTGQILFLASASFGVALYQIGRATFIK